MTRIVARIALAALTSGILVLAVLSVWQTASLVQPAQATHNLEIGIDTDPSQTPANTATSLGSTEWCLAVGRLDPPFDVDVYITDVTNLLGWQAYLEFDPTLLAVIAVDLMFQEAQPGSNVTNGSGPAGSGRHVLVGGEGGNAYEDDGSGVLARVTLDPQGAIGVSDLTLDFFQEVDGVATGPYIKDADGNFLGDTDADSYYDGPFGNARVAIDQPDSDGDGIVDPCEDDDDDDGVPNSVDQCAFTAPGVPVDTTLALGCSASQVDADSDGICDPGEVSTWCSGSDNCPGNYNPNQLDFDNDGMGNECDPDTDNDGVCNPGVSHPSCTGSDNCPYNSDPNQDDFDGDGAGDICDDDDDGDGYKNGREISRGSDPWNYDSTPEVCDGIDNDLNGGIDEDDANAQYDLLPLPSGNGVADCMEAVDTDGDTVVNTIDLDDDNDGQSDEREIYMRTDTLDACPDSSSDEAWWADVNNSAGVNINDISKFRVPFMANLGEPLYDKRFDVNMSGKINIQDVSTMRAPVFGGSCVN